MPDALSEAKALFLPPCASFQIDEDLWPLVILDWAAALLVIGSEEREFGFLFCMNLWQNHLEKVKYN